jgi:ribosomal protein S28E/S33
MDGERALWQTLTRTVLGVVCIGDLFQKHRVEQERRRLYPYRALVLEIRSKAA